ncbi:ETS homologous factor isoform X3 [Octopus vulgaris]|nr:ETS homologous factor isoform X3 [Octopus vulgaris]
MEDFAFPWDCFVEKREEQEEENSRREVAIPELSLLLENNNDHNDCLMSTAISDYETSGSGHGKRLFHFLLHLLDNNRDNNAIIRWENRSEGLFRICCLSTLATLWGREKNNFSMDHNKLRRALGYYIDKGKLLKVDRHLYKFTTDFKDSKFMKSSSHHQSSFEYPSKYRETFNSDGNSPLSIIDESTRSGDIFNPPPVFVGSESINYDVCCTQHEIPEATGSKSFESWYCDKTIYKKLVNVNSSDSIYSSNIDIPILENFNSSSASDNCSSLSPNDSLLSDTSDFSLKLKRSSSEICLPDSLPNKRYCPETAQNITFSDSDFSNPQKVTDLLNDDWHDQYIVPDTGLQSYKDLSPDSNHFPSVRFDYSEENGSYDVDMSSNFQSLLEDLHKELQFLNNA